MQYLFDKKTRKRGIIGLIALAILALVSLYIAFGSPVALASPSPSHLAPSQRPLKQCKRVGQKHCRVDVPGYAGRCLRFHSPGRYVIFYKQYPRRLKAVVCFSRLR